MESTALPACDLVEQGMCDLKQGKETIAALAVLVAATRLRQLGIAVPVPASAPADPEARLYELLELEHGDGAHSRFNAIRRSLVSFARAAACVAR